MNAIKINAGIPVSIFWLHDGIAEWAGDGHWDGESVQDCAADLPDDVYEEIDRLMAKGALTSEVAGSDGETYEYTTK